MADFIETTKSHEIQHIGYLDAAKGLGIFFVVCGHTAILSETFIPFQWIVKYIYIFHMQLFFCVSGMCRAYQVERKGRKPFCVAVKSLATRLLIPYFLWSFLYLLIARVEGIHENLMERAIAIFTFRGIAPLWFLAALFLVEFFGIFLNKLKSQEIVVVAVASFFIMVAMRRVYDPQNQGYFISYCITTLGRFFVNLPAYCLGCLLARSAIIDKVNQKKSIIIGAAFIVAMILLVYVTQIGVNLHTFDIGSPLVFIVGSTLGVLGNVFFAKGIDNKLIEYVGRSSLSIMVLHYVPFPTIAYMTSLCTMLPIGLVFQFVLAVVLVIVACIVGKFFVARKLFIA